LSWEDSWGSLDEFVPFGLVQHEGGHIGSGHRGEPIGRLDVFAGSIMRPCRASGQFGRPNNRPGKPAGPNPRFIRRVIRNRSAQNDLHELLERKAKLMTPAWNTKKRLIDEPSARSLSEGGEDALNAISKRRIAADRRRRTEAADHRRLAGESTLDGGGILKIATHGAEVRVVERELGGLAHKGAHDVVPRERLLHDLSARLARGTENEEFHAVLWCEKTT